MTPKAIRDAANTPWEEDEHGNLTMVCARCGDRYQIHKDKTPRWHWCKACVRLILSLGSLEVPAPRRN